MRRPSSRPTPHRLWKKNDLSKLVITQMFSKVKNKQIRQVGKCPLPRRPPLTGVSYFFYEDL